MSGKLHFRCLRCDLGCSRKEFSVASDSLKRDKIAKRMNKVLPCLYIGSFKDYIDLELTNGNDIRAVISIVDTKLKSMPGITKHLLINATDEPSTQLEQFFDESNYFIHRNRLLKCNVLVHCYAGISRAATIVAAYLIAACRIEPEVALDAIRACRPYALPNLGFKNQLNHYSSSIGKKEKMCFWSLETETIQIEDDRELCEELARKYREEQKVYVKLGWMM